MKSPIFRFLLLIGLLLLPLSLQAQGELGFGEADDTTMSLAERVTNIEQKFKSFNVYVNFNGNLHTEQSYGNDEFSTNFQAKNLRLEVKGQIGDKIYYRIRQRLNKATNATDDGLAKATDYAMIGYRPSPQWLISVGKMGQYFGGFEFDQNAIYVYQASDISDYADGSKLGIAFTWTPTKNHTFVAQITNALNGNLYAEYEGIEKQEIYKSKSPLTYVAHWSGQFAEGFYRTKCNVLYRSLAKDNGSTVMVLGQSINGKWGRVFLDYAFEHDDFDFMRFCSIEANKHLRSNQAYLTDLTYHGLVARTDIKIGKHLIFWAEGMYQTASCGSNKKLDGFRKHYNYLAGIEYVPNPDYKVRYTLNYQGQYYDYSKKCGIPDQSVNRIEAGILCRIKCF